MFLINANTVYPRAALAQPPTVLMCCDSSNTAGLRFRELSRNKLLVSRPESDTVVSPWLSELLPENSKSCINEMLKEGRKIFYLECTQLILCLIVWFQMFGKGHREEGRKEMFYLTTHSTYFSYGYMASDIW